MAIPQLKGPAMYLIEILLPLANNAGQAFDKVY
jgi:hypothetical protein